MKLQSDISPTELERMESDLLSVHDPAAQYRKLVRDSLVPVVERALHKVALDVSKGESLKLTSSPEDAIKAFSKAFLSEYKINTPSLSSVIGYLFMPRSEGDRLDTLREPFLTPGSDSASCADADAELWKLESDCADPRNSASDILVDERYPRRESDLAHDTDHELHRTVTVHHGSSRPAVAEEAGPHTRRMRRGIKGASGSGKIYAACVGEYFDNELLLSNWQKDGALCQMLRSVDAIRPADSAVDADHSVLVTSLHREGAMAFVLDMGSVVCWDLSSVEVDALISVLFQYADPATKTHPNRSQKFQDDFVYVPPEMRGIGKFASLSFIRSDVVYLASNRLEEKIAISYAMAQSVKLDEFESACYEVIETIEDMPIHMIQTGSMGIVSKNASKMIGTIFVQRARLNLHSDILDNPNILWDADAALPVYQMARKYLDVGKRLKILNHRLNVMRDMFLTCQNEVHVEHSARLEWVIILLILFNVVVDIVAILGSLGG